MSKLTSRQQEILEYIRDFAYEEGCSPTRMEIAEAFGFRSPNAAEEHLRALDRKGAIELLQGSSRGIRILGDDREEDGLPVIGRVAAGSPILAEEHIEDHYPVDPRPVSSARPLPVAGQRSEYAGYWHYGWRLVSGASY